MSDTLAAVLREEVDWARLPRTRRRRLRPEALPDPRPEGSPARHRRRPSVAVGNRRGPLGTTSSRPRASALGLWRRACRGWPDSRWAHWWSEASLEPFSRASRGAAPGRLSHLRGSDSLPTASSDGRMVPFVSTRDGRSRIWLKQMATGEEVGAHRRPLGHGSSLLSRWQHAVVPARGRCALQPFPGGGGGRDRARVTDGVAPTRPGPRTGNAWRGRASVPGGVPDTLVTLGLDGGDERELARVKEFALGNLRWRPDGAT